MVFAVQPDPPSDPAFDTAEALKRIIVACRALDTDALMGTFAVVLAARVSRECSHDNGLRILAQFNTVLNRSYAVWEEIRQDERDS